jgi:AraC family transcriptional regulator
MMKAARLMLEKQDMALLDIALIYGYSTNESFTRAFKQVWNCKPSEFRKNSRFSELFPRINAPLEDGDEYMKDRRHVDISEMYDLFKSRKDCYFVCCDIKSLIPINKISRKAGDLALSETMKRMLDCSSDDDIVFRFGADEFAILTNSEDISYAESIVNKILALNGNTFTFEKKEISLNLYTSITKADEGTMHYDQLFTKLSSSIRKN